MDSFDVFDEHFDAVRAILLPYKGNKIIDAIPSALLFVIQLHHALPATDEFARLKLLRHLDSVTDMFGKVGDIVSDEDFEKLKNHYVEIQLLASQGKDKL